MRPALAAFLPRAAAVLALLALLVAARELPRSLRTDHERVESNAGLSSLDRELAPARFWGMNSLLLRVAEGLLPRDAVYSIAAGRREVAKGEPLFYAYWLLPRRRAHDPRRADWILLDGVPRSALPVDTQVIADAGDGSQILLVRR